MKSRETEFKVNKRETSEIKSREKEKIVVLERDGENKKKCNTKS